jgi:hypothetical protein
MINDIRTEWRNGHTGFAVTLYVAMLMIVVGVAGLVVLAIAGLWQLAANEPFGFGLVFLLATGATAGFFGIVRKA